MLTQRLGPEPQHVAYLSKRRNPVDRLKPPCLQNLAAIVTLIADVLKLSFRGKLIIFTSHLNGNPLQNYCLENPMDRGAWPSTVHGSQRVRHNWVISLSLSSKTTPKWERPYMDVWSKNPQISSSADGKSRPDYIPLWVVNWANLLPIPKGSLPFHSCLETLDHWTKSGEGLSQDSLTNPEEISYTDGSSFVFDGKKRARYTVVSNLEIIGAEPLPPGTSAQLAELIALTQTLDLGEGGKKSSHLHWLQVCLSTAICTCCNL